MMNNGQLSAPFGAALEQLRQRQISNAGKSFPEKMLRPL
jgi:hypothetical protein